jgi:F-type H+-transporting ATPase subunit c
VKFFGNFETEEEKMGLVAIGAGLALLSCGLVGFGMTIATGKAVEAVARQPEASSKVTSALIMGLALAESTAIYAFVSSLIMMFTMKS